MRWRPVQFLCGLHFLFSSDSNLPDRGKQKGSSSVFVWAYLTSHALTVISPPPTAGVITVVNCMLQNVSVCSAGAAVLLGHGQATLLALQLDKIIVVSLMSAERRAFILRRDI